MLCFETSFLIDWFRGQAYAREFLEDTPSDERLQVPTVVVHELLVGALGTGGYPSTADDLCDNLAHTEFVPLTTTAAEEAAEIRVTLTGEGKKIGAVDSLIAGTARDTSATLVTTDDHYTRVDGLDVLDPRRN